MEKLSFRQLLSKTNEQRQEEDINCDVEQKELQLSASISETKKALSSKRKERANYICTVALDFEKLSIMDDEIEGLEAGVKRLEEYKTIFFPAK